MDISEALSNASVKITQKYVPNVLDKETPLANELVASFLSVDLSTLDQKKADKINDIYEYARQKAGTDDEMKVLEVLKDIKYRMGATNFGESKLGQLHKYVHLRSLAQRYDTQAQAMEQ